MWNFKGLVQAPEFLSWTRLRLLTYVAAWTAASSLHEA